MHQRRVAEERRPDTWHAPSHKPAYAIGQRARSLFPPPPGHPRLRSRLSRFHCRTHDLLDESPLPHSRRDADAPRRGAADTARLSRSAVAAAAARSLTAWAAARGQGGRAPRSATAPRALAAAPRGGREQPAPAVLTAAGAARGERWIRWGQCGRLLDCWLLALLVLMD